LADQRKKVTLALFVVTFLAAIEGTIVSTAMPIITKDLEGLSLFSWINTIYLLAMVVTTPVYGKLSDMYGRKSTLLIGAIVFLIGSILSGIAWSMESLILFRAIQGLGGGCLLTLPLVIITDLYDLEQRAKIQGWLSSIWGIAGISGPIVGGLLVDYLSWRAIFYMNIPFGALALYLIIRYMKDKARTSKASIDYAGIATFSIGILSFLYGLNQYIEGFSSSQEQILYISCMLFGIIMLYVFYRIERVVKEPFIPLSLFSNKLLTFSFVGGFIISMINVAIIFYVPLWMQGMKGESATYSGMVMIPLSITWPLGSILAGQFISKFGLKRLCLIGSAFLILGNVGMATIQNNTSVWLIMLYIGIAGISFGILLTVFTIIVSFVANVNNRGAAMSSTQLLRSLGQAIGLAIFGLFLFSNELDPQYVALLEQSLQFIFLLVAILSLVMVAFVIVVVRQKSLFEEYGLSGNKHTAAQNERTASSTESKL